MSNKQKICFIEPAFFLFFGLMHVSRIWAFIDRSSYSGFWLSLAENRNWFYFLMTGLMSALCIAGIALFIRNWSRNQWWRWVYPFGGGYLLFDLFAILIRLRIWNRLLSWMFDITNPLWNVLWGTFVMVGFAALIIGIMLWKRLAAEHAGWE